MVKTPGPALSLAASGSLGQALTFSTAKGRAYLKRKPTPKQPRSGLQASMRAMMKFLTQNWQHLDAQQQATWADAYATQFLSTYNAYLRYNLVRWRRTTPPSKAYPATEEHQPAVMCTFTATGGVRHVNLNAKLDINPEDNWSGLLFHKPGAWPSPKFAELVYVFRLDDLDTHTWIHSPLPVGTHYYLLLTAADDGNTNWEQYQIDNALVT